MARIRWLVLLALPIILSFLTFLPPGSEKSATAQDPTPPRLRGHLSGEPLSPRSGASAQQLSTNVDLLGQIGGQALAVAVQGDTAYVGVGPRLMTVDVTYPLTPTLLGSTTPLPGIVTGVAISGTHAYLSDDDQGLKIVDVSIPASPTVVGSLQTPGVAEGIAVVGNLAYIADYSKGLRIIDVSNPTAPVEVGSLQTAGYAMAITVAGNYAYVASYFMGTSLRIVNVSNPGAPTEVGSYTRTRDFWAIPQAVQVVGSTAYIAGGSSGLRVISVANPALPMEIGSYDTPGDMQGISVVGTNVFVADGNGGLEILSAVSPTYPTLTGTLSMPGAALGIVVAGNYAYVADGDAGLRIVNISTPASPSEASSVAPPGSALGLAVAGSYAYVADGDRGLRIINISTPTTPTETGALDTPGYANVIAVSGNFAYLADKRAWTGGGLHIIDVSTPVSPVERSFFPMIIDITGVAVSGNYAYVTDGYRGLRILDVSNPASPSEVSFSLTPQPALGVAVAPGLAPGSNYAFIADGYSGLRTVDVSNPLAPTTKSPFATPGVAQGVAVNGTLAYIADATTGLRVFDVTNPTYPLQVGQFALPGGASAVVLDGHYAYLLDNQKGLDIIDVVDPKAMTKVASYELPLNGVGVAAVNGIGYVGDAGAGLHVLGCTNCGSLRADFTGTPTEGASPLSVTFTNQSTGPYTGSIWDFGDGSTSTAQNPPPHSYTSGVYTVTLTISGPGSPDVSLTRPACITVYTPPVADFTATPITGTVPLSVTFTNKSTGSFDSSSWDFGDGSSSTENSPTHTYTATGVYTVTLGIKGSGGTAAITKTSLITVTEAPPVADFSTCDGKTSGHAPFTACFVNNSTGHFDGSVWNFGDGTTLSKSDPGHALHVYSVPGSYTVTLTVNGPGGSDTITRTNYILVPDVVASFTADPLSGPVGLVVTFTNTSTGAYTASQWDFGDGSPISAQQNPTHTYTIAGSYSVTLTVIGPDGSDTFGQANYITVYGAPTAEFTATPLSGTRPLNVAFTNQSTGSYTTSQWTFGDSSPISTEQNPTHTYVLPGSYSVTLQVSGPSGSNSKTRTDYITVQDVGTPVLLLQNGDFESGVILPWMRGGGSLATVSTSQAHGGTRSARLGFSTSLIPGYMYQNVTIPADTTTATLTFWYWPKSGGQGAQSVFIRTPLGVVLSNPMHVLENDQAWKSRTIDLTSYKGQTIQIYFESSGGMGNPNTGMFLDDVVLNVTTP